MKRVDAHHHEGDDKLTRRLDGFFRRMRLSVDYYDIKVRDAILLTAETDATKIKALRLSHPQRKIISIPPEMAFGTGDHATTSTCLRLLVDVARARKGTDWTVADLGTGTGVLAIAALEHVIAGPGQCEGNHLAQ